MPSQQSNFSMSTESTQGFRLDFVGVGCASSGTTWLHRILDEHPQICMPKQKELFYFCSSPHWGAHSNYQRGKDWLRRQFPRCPQNAVRGEISPVYIVDADAPQRLHAHSPSLNILVSFRNPTDRLYSMYHMLNRLYPLPDSFEAFLEDRPDFLETGNYNNLISPYMERFPREQFFFILFEEMRRDPEAVFRDLYRFLGVNEDFTPPSLHAKINPRRAPRSALLRNTVGYATLFMNRNRLGRACNVALESLGIHRLARWLMDKNTVPVETPPMHPDTRQMLDEYYAPQVRALGQRLDLDLRCWIRTEQ